MDDLLLPHIEELTATQIAERVGRDARTVQRWLKSGKLPSHALANHRYAVNTVDLKHFALPEHVGEESAIALDIMRAADFSAQEQIALLEERLSDLSVQLYQAEEKIGRLEYRLNQVIREQREQKQAVAKKRKKKVQRRRGYISLGDVLPLDLLPLYPFAEDHGVPASAVRKALAEGELFAERGQWYWHGQWIKVGIDERGAAIFYELFHEHARFRQCDSCPHSW